MGVGRHALDRYAGVGEDSAIAGAFALVPRLERLETPV